MNNQPISQEDASHVLDILIQDEENASLFFPYGLTVFEQDMIELADDGAPQPKQWRAAR